jgi:hypothetical protein
MANMSYCRFENTYRDLVDCLQALNDSGVDSLSDRELQYAKMMIQVCENIVNHYDEVLDEVEERTWRIEE